MNFSIMDGTGSLSNETARTNSSGVANVSTWQIGTVAGLNVVGASTAQLLSVRFEVTGVAGAAASMIKVAGDNQAAARGSAVPMKPQVITCVTQMMEQSSRSRVCLLRILRRGIYSVSNPADTRPRMP